MKRILMISYPFPPNASAGAVRSERFARYLPQFGWAVEIVTIKAREDMYHDKDRLENLGDYVNVHITKTFDPWLRLHKIVPRNRILRAVRSALMSLFSFPDHMVFWVPFALAAALKISKSQKIDAVYTTSPPHSTHVAGMLITRILGIPWIADYRDPWSFKPDIYRVKSNTLKRIERALDRQVIKNASLVITNTERAREKLLETFREVLPDKVACITNGWEPLFSDDDYDFSRNQFIIMHAGTFYPRFKPYELLYAVARWKLGKQAAGIPAFEDVMVVLLGAGDAETKKVVKDLGLDSIVEFKGAVPLREAQGAMRGAHMLWTSLGVGKQAEMSLPSKIFEYIGARRPILAFFPDGDAAALIRRSGTGIVFDYDDADRIIEALHFAIVSRRNKQMPYYNPNWNILDLYRIDNIVKILVEKLDIVASHVEVCVKANNDKYEVN